MEFSGSVTLNARYPIYYGFGNSPESVAVDANKLSARTSAAGTYNDTAISALQSEGFTVSITEA